MSDDPEQNTEEIYSWLGSQEDPSYDDNVIKARDRFVRLVGTPVLRNAARPPEGCLPNAVKWRIADHLNEDPENFHRLEGFADMFSLTRILVEKAPVPLNSLRIRFPKYSEEPHDLLRCEYSAFEYLSVELARKCIAADAILCFTLDAGYYAPADAEIFGEDSQFSLPPARDPITGRELAAHFMEHSGAEGLAFVFYDKAIEAAPEIWERNKEYAEKSRDKSRASNQQRGFTHKDRPYIDEAYELLVGEKVSSAPEAAYEIAKTLWAKRDEFTGKFPGTSLDALSSRIYKGLLKKRKHM